MLMQIYAEQIKVFIEVFIYFIKPKNAQIS